MNVTLLLQENAVILEAFRKAARIAQTAWPRRDRLDRFASRDVCCGAVGGV